MSHEAPTLGCQMLLVVELGMVRPWATRARKRMSMSMLTSEEALQEKEYQ